MKLPWKYGVLMFVCLPFHVFAHSNTPDDEAIKRKFIEKSGGIMRLESVALRQLETTGERTTYRIEGDVASTDNIYDMVGAVGDYIFFERTWTKGQPVKFSAIMTTVGTTSSDWEMDFSAPQTAAKNSGRPFRGKEDLSKYLIVNEPGFRAQLAKIDSRFSASMTVVKKQNKEFDVLKQKLTLVNKKLLNVWGTDGMGQPIGSSAFQHARFQELAALDAKNDSDKFEEQYDARIYEPALAACKKKAGCVSTSIDATRNAALDKQMEEATRQHQLMLEKIEVQIAEYEKKEASLLNASNTLRDQMEGLESSNREMSRAAEQWREGIERLRKEKIIPQE